MEKRSRDKKELEFMVVVGKVSEVQV